MATEVDRTDTSAEEMTATQTVAYATRGSNPFTFVWWYLRRYPVIPIFILVLLLLAAIIGPYLAPFPRDEAYQRDRLLGIGERSRAADHIELGSGPVGVVAGYQPCPLIDPGGRDVPSNQTKCGQLHLLGADHAGRDIFSRLLHGSRISIAVVTFSLTSGMILGTAVALFSGYYGGILDEIVTRFVDIWNALPFLMVAIVVTQLFGAKVDVLFWRVDMLLFVLMLVAWVGFVRVIRAQVFVLRELDYVAAARVAGASDIRIIWRHLVPGIMNTVIVVASLNTSGLILAESTLSFVGAGIQPPTPAWGVMTNQGRDYILEAPHITLVPGTAIFLVVLSMNFFGDWLRDRLDPRLRQVA